MAEFFSAIYFQSVKKVATPLFDALKTAFLNRKRLKNAYI